MTERLRDAALAFLAGGHASWIGQVLHGAHPADLADVVRIVSREDQLRLLRGLGEERAGRVLPEVDDETRRELVATFHRDELARILGWMRSKDAADVIADLSLSDADAMLRLMKGAQAEEIEAILDYPEGSAGRLMSPDFIAVPESNTVADAIRRIHESVFEDRAYEVYVVDDRGRLVGLVPLRRLLITDAATPMTSIRDASVVSVTDAADQEAVARLVLKYDLVSIPVIDRAQRLIGTIAVNDVVDVLGEEASKDIFGIAGSDAAELERRSPSQVALLRLPWVLATLVIELAAGVIIHAFDATLARVILLASFMPVIQAISGNTGLQSVTTVVRGLAMGQIELNRWREPLRRQIQTSSILGGVCALAVGSVGSLWHSTEFGLVVALSMFISVNLSGAAGTIIPMLSKRLGFDPALTAGPFATALQDVLGVTIFLSLATALVHRLT